MERRRKILIAKSAAALSVIPVLVYAYQAGPDPGKTGVPGEGICAEAGCHVGTAVNGGGGSVKVTFPNGLTYTPGVKQHFTVTVSDPAQRRWGFQLTARVASSLKTQAGSFTIGTDGFTQIICSGANLIQTACNSSTLQFIEHTLTGTRPGTTGGANFDFDWTPPASDVGNIAIYVAGNAANGDNNNTGDHIYTANYTLTPSGGGGNNPIISAVTSSASGAAISPGSWITVWGSNLSATTRSWRADEIVNGQLPSQLDGVSVTVNGKTASMEYISPGQVNAVAPADDAVGPVQVQLKNSNASSAPFTAQLQSFSPAFFLFDGKYLAAQHAADFSPVGKPGLLPGATFTPAKPGETIILYGTGFGPTNPPMPADKLADKIANVSNPVTIHFNGTSVTPSFAGLLPQFVALYQINVQVPASAPNGDLRVVATLGGVDSPSNGSSCCFITVQK